MTQHAEQVHIEYNNRKSISKLQKFVIDDMSIISESQLNLDYLQDAHDKFVKTPIRTKGLA